ncbi:exodeoxyribonuclease VII small subunit [Candidatus Bipolaricaulota bacterium]|jgi:exodeoxyribonuclease VII small subunit|nr:exodeoxyribonuclease VII small subunit [Candidatus Bipolaricaulota bacterium]
MNLEQNLKQLEDIAKKLESEELPLDEAIELFERGISLSTSIRTALNEAKLRIEAVVEGANDTFAIEPLDLESS